MKTIKRLAVNIPVINDATSFYRAANPLSQIARSYPGLFWNTLHSWNDATAIAHDAAFFQRPGTFEHRGAIQMCLEAGLKVWVDYDDLLTEVPTDNPGYFQYMNKSRQDDIIWCISNATVVTVSTPFLAQKYSQFNKNVKVVPNACDMRLACIKERAEPGTRNKIISWRGTPTHLRDVFGFSRAILHVSRDEHPLNKEWQWHFIGDTMWFITDSMPHAQTFITKPMGPIEYFKHIQALRPSLMQVPLNDSHFNRCKSNIAWMEAAFAGAAALVPNWQEWDMPGAIKYKDEEEYANGLYAVINGDVDVAALAKQSWDYIKSELTLEKVNEARMDVLCEILDCDRNDLR